MDTTHTLHTILASIAATLFLGFIYTVSTLFVMFIVLISWVGARKVRARQREIAEARDVSDVPTETVQLLGVLDARDLITGGTGAVWRLGVALSIAIAVVGLGALAQQRIGTKTQAYVDQPRGYLIIRENGAGVVTEDDFISWTTQGSVSAIQGNWYVYVRPGPRVTEPQPQTFTGTIDGSQVTLRVTSAVRGMCGVRLVTGQLAGLGQEELDLYDYDATAGKIIPLVAHQGSYRDFTAANAAL